MDYWPSYSNLAPASRTAYLEWLAAGRPGGAHIGYVFLFFYGIERRVLFDATYIDEAHTDIPALIDEVERLIDLYQDNSSFQGYAGNFRGGLVCLNSAARFDKWNRAAVR